MFFGQKYILHVSLRPLGLTWGPREHTNYISTHDVMRTLGIGPKTVTVCSVNRDIIVFRSNGCDRRVLWPKIHLTYDS